METKKDRFVRIGEARTNRVLEQIRLLGNCSNKNNYEYSEDDIKKIFSVIDKELRICKNKFNSNFTDKFTLK